MNNKRLGLILVLACILIGLVIFSFDRQLNQQTEANCDCEEMQSGGMCSKEERLPWQTYFGIILISGMAALGIYLIFFEKSQKAIISTLEKQKQVQTSEEKFNILLKGLNENERKIIKAVKEQDGITQQTLRLRTDMHKSKLSIVLDGLEKKGLIARKEKGKTKQVFLKMVL
ncbi:hypothetical protein CL621_04845 [archaeon]|nr:hypothetical protein [archaeon]|tara:strand:+ start:3085 stop:3600 length:516 start_codon:yes stop_codon:yes gene_type:complete